MGKVPTRNGKPSENKILSVLQELCGMKAKTKSWHLDTQL